MTRFVLLAVVIGLLGMALVGGAMLYGRDHPGRNSLRELGFDVCESKPCFMHITPDKTAWRDALAKFAADPSFWYHDNSLFTVQTGDSTVGFSRIHSRNDVDAIQVSVGADIRAQNVFELYGTPCNVVNWYSTTAQVNQMKLSLYYPTLIVILNPTDHLMPSTSVSLIALVNEPNACSAAFATNSRWMGFVSRQTFVTRSQLQ